MTPSKPTKTRPYQVHGYECLSAGAGVREDFDQWLESQGSAGKPLRMLRAQMIHNQGGEQCHHRLGTDRH